MRALAVLCLPAFRVWIFDAPFSVPTSSTVTNARDPAFLPVAFHHSATASTEATFDEVMSASSTTMKAANIDINDKQAAQDWQSRKSDYPNLDGEHPLQRNMTR